MSEQINPSPESSPREDFGHLVEREIVAESLKEIPTIEIVEMGTKDDDRLEHVDLWVKFDGWDAPVGIQTTISESPERMHRKIEEFPKRVEKHDAPESKIKGIGKVCWAVLVTGDQKEFAEHYRTYLAMKRNRPGAEPQQFLPDHIKADLYRQIIKGYSRALSDQPRLKDQFIQTLASHS
jgi:hypothetical protein